ncbi:site-specific integrase, partial [Streptomyces sp. DSM 42041]|nr:site-specific integrase [Streptomyces sp. DSM 42041]
LGEAGASLLMLIAKSRHKKPENVRRYFKPSPDALAEIISLLAPGDSRR